ncbi:hypothetical protein COCCADRAFT_40505 [Bipolaris zeicola 26-R-13]|uniref:Uncharacterized protein n=1 Tax=Cochliobolus carbonum (strain 26-R-13) TaxID=930089 RepID=W6XTU1_COCC2|nr:uncharacterized protein COCCADRAFT_40505 [Bipolaris zeicola 26-R-13]EUC29063.1 hypothetical protein COCCADRAFT_40505 [Bipolaris zeicola 26-R-13]
MMGLASRIRLRFRGPVHVVPIRAVHEIACASQIRNGWILVNASHPLRAGVVVLCPRIVAETRFDSKGEAVRLRALRSVSRPHPLTSSNPPATAHVKLEPERATHARLIRLMLTVHLHAGSGLLE